jgi:hypothetical protein
MTSLATAPLIFMGLLLALNLIGERDALGPLVLLLAMCMAGIAGMVACIRLTITFYSGGRPALRVAKLRWWLALVCGSAAALAVFFVFLFDDGVLTERLAILFFGPLLLPLAAILFWLRFAGSFGNEPSQEVGR